VVDRLSRHRNVARFFASAAAQGGVAMTMPTPRQNRIEIRVRYSISGRRTWSVDIRDLFFGPRRFGLFNTRQEAVAAAVKLSRDRRIPFVGARRAAKVVAHGKKFAAWERRQARVAQRAAKWVQP
jgi:hypothetical protein